MKRTTMANREKSQIYKNVDAEVNKLLKDDQESQLARSRNKQKFFYLDAVEQKKDPTKMGTDSHTTLIPTLQTVMMIKDVLGVILILSGLATLMSFFFVSKQKRSTVLAVQTAQGDQTIGMLSMTPESRTVLVFNPILCISIVSVLVGCWMLGSMRFDPIKNIFIKEITLSYSARIMYYQVIVQSTFIVLTVMPLAGVVNVYELAFSAALTWAEFLMYLHSDVVNIIALNNWELVDTARNPVAGNPMMTLMRTYPKQPPFFVFNYEPLIGAISMHTFIYIIMMIHLIQSMSSLQCDTNPFFNTVVILTTFLQFMIPLTKLLQMVRNRYLQWFTVYKFTVVAIEIIQVVNMVLIQVFLVLGSRK
jgi:hypothetical protein